MKANELREFFMTEIPEFSDFISSNSLEELAEATKSYRGMSAIKACLQLNITGAANRSRVENLAKTQGGIYSESTAEDSAMFGMVYVVRPANLNTEPSFWFEQASDAVETIVFLLDDERRHVCFIERSAPELEMKTDE